MASLGGRERKCRRPPRRECLYRSEALGDRAERCVEENKDHEETLPSRSLEYKFHIPKLHAMLMLGSDLLYMGNVFHVWF